MNFQVNKDGIGSVSRTKDYIITGEWTNLNLWDINLII